MLYHNVPGAVKASFLTSILLGLYLFFGARSFYRDPGSIFYNRHRAFERSYSLHRQTEATAFRNQAFFSLSTNQTDAIPIWKAGVSPKICAVIVTAARGLGNGPHPLELSVTSMLTGLTKPEREDLDLRVYFANTKPSDHPFWNSWLLGLVDKFESAQSIVSSTEFQTLEELEAAKSFFHKSGLDFSYALEDCYRSSRSPYIAIFEGDVIVADGWFARARMGLKNIAERTAITKEPWLDMRMFNEEGNIGWDTTSLLGNNVPYLAAGFSAIFLGFTLLFRRYTRFPTISNSALFFLCFITIPLVIMLFFQTGKSSTIRPAAGISVQDWGCCSQALILQREQAPGLVKELRDKSPTMSADIIVLDYARAQNLRRYVLNPVQVQHLGFNSILDPGRPKDHLVWSMAFEDLKSQRLKKDHASMVSQLYEDEGSPKV